MNATLSQPPAATTWQDEIRAGEKASLAAFLAADLAALDRLWAADFVVNSPLQRVLTKPQVFEALKTGRIRHLACECEIECITRHGDCVVVLGHDRVIDPPDNVVSRRRYTNVWQLQAGTWRKIARHAHVVSREPAG